MKIKIYESQNRNFTGYTDIQIKRKIDGQAEGAVGAGGTIEEALEDTIKYFLDIINSDYPEGLQESDIEYAEYSDF